MTSTDEAVPARRLSVGERVGDALSVTRAHIILIAVVAEVTFGWLLTGRYPLGVAAVTAIDWFVINLVNRVTDIDEDLKNGIRGTAAVARRRRALVLFCGFVLALSFAVTARVLPSLTPLRIAVQLIGLAYSVRVLPTGRGWTRWKEIYFLKNFMSAVLFVLTCIAYPIAAAPPGTNIPWAMAISLAAFFVPFELTYEILYDLRDLDGDRAEGIPTFPVVHGPETARRIVDALLALSAVVLLASLALGAIGVREALMLVAPASQRRFYRRRLERGLTRADCILVTHLGTAELLLFLVGTALWLRLGLPPDFFLRTA